MLLETVEFHLRPSPAHAIESIQLAKREIIKAGQLKPFILRDGWAVQQAVARSGERQILSILLPGDAFVGPSPLSVFALTSCTVEFVLSGGIKRSSLYQIDDADHLLRYATAIGRNTAIQRLGFLLIHLAKRLAPEELGDGLKFRCLMTQADMADFCCVTAVHINRMVKELRQRDIVAMTGRDITILNYRELQQITE